MRSNHQEGQRTFHLTEAKLKALSHISQFFCLTCQDLAFLSYGEISPSVLRSMRRTISLLEKEGLVEWRGLIPRIRRRGSPPLVYGLTYKGILKVKDEGLSTPATKVFKPNSDNLLPHEYEITLFHLYVERVCKEHGLSLYWRQRDTKCTINPDALFAITDPKKPEGENTLYYFLEVEKTKPGNFRDGQSKITRNLAKYYSYFDTDQCEKEWVNFRKFRVTIVVRNDERRRNLLTALRARYSHRMFWVTTEHLYREDIGGRIFLTPRDCNTESYSFT